MKFYYIDYYCLMKFIYIYIYYLYALFIIDKYITIKVRKDVLRVRGTRGESLQVQSPREWPLRFVAYDIIVLCVLHMVRHNALTGS